ncbi:hypothetical protein CYY_005802 [Polysphondylium violaceum]|uniref:Zinc finger protein n=1 Tax=Polysphondylium violaceum TaxID=133409 RepID=A0A8J4PSB0_9MYCE|nr:hypothetical protein CYY_005802 [Polysphondylium violaceum]
MTNNENLDTNKIDSIDSNNTTNTIESNNTTAPTAPVCVFKKLPKVRNIRKRDTDTIIQDNTPTAATTTKEEDQNEQDNTEEQQNKKLKTKINQYSTKDQNKKKEFSFEASGTAKSYITEAEVTSTEFLKEGDDDDLYTNRKSGDKDKDTSVNNDDGLYRGMKSYNNYVEKKSDLTYKGTGVKAGPIRNATTVRLSSRIDYQPDVCKDYKQTGQCTFGDACKFLHDRSDYKSGWQIDKEYEEEQKRKASGGEPITITTDKKEEELPFACFICKKEYDNPVMTKCKHFFCEQCALDHNAKSKKCFICGEQTQGAFSQPKKIIDKLVAKSRAHFSQS